MSTAADPVRVVSARLVAAAACGVCAWVAWCARRASALRGPSPDLSRFEIERVLDESRESRRVALLGRFRGREGRAIVVIEKAPLDGGVEALSELLRRVPPPAPTVVNPPYSFCEAALPAGVAGSDAAKVEVVWPCTERHVRKHTRVADVVLRETPADYALRHEPVVPPPSHASWVEAILDGSAEADRVLASDPDPRDGYVVLPDSKWLAGHDRADDMYLLALCRRRGVRSLRDLRGNEHLPMLRNMRRGLLEAASSLFGVPAARLSLYLHYAPSYYHLHVHAVATSRAVRNDGAGRAHPLDDVIDNLERDPLHYERATLTLRVAGSHALAAAAAAAAAAAE